MLSAQYLLRTARRSDIPAMAALIEEFAQYMRELGDTTELRLNAETLERDGFGNDPAFYGIVADESGEIVGFLLYHAGYDTDAACRLLFIVDLYVTSSRRDQGMGAALMNEARRIAAESGAKQMVWTVDKRNTAGKRFYERIGAHYVDQLDLMYLDV